MSKVKRTKRMEKKDSLEWIQFYKVNQDLLTSIGDSLGTYRVFPKFGLVGPAYKNLDGHIFYDKESIEKIRHQIANDPIGFSEKLLPAMKKKCDAFEKFSEALSRTDYSKKNISELNLFWKKFSRNYIEFGGYFGIPVFIEKVIEQKLQEKLAETGSDAAFGPLTTFAGELPSGPQKKELLTIAAEINRYPKIKKEVISLESDEQALEGLEKNLPMIFSEIKKYVQKWVFTGVHILEGNPLSQRDVLSRLRDALKQNPGQELEAIKKTEQEAKKNFETTLAANPAAGGLAKISQEIIFLRDYRFISICKGGYYSQPLLKEIAKRLGCTYNDVLYLLPEELDKALGKKKLDRGLVKDRQKGYGFFFSGGKYKVIGSQQVNALLEEEKKNFPHIREFRGQVAFPGHAQGIAKVVLNIKQLSKAGAGDILVAPQTMPTFVPLMKKVSAIVTDLGGITSHAAIVSRELRVPCIVGTGIASKVISDGDEIEVDAKNGIVRIIQKASDRL